MDERVLRDLKYIGIGTALTLLTVALVYTIFFSNILTTYAGIDTYRYAESSNQEVDTSIEDAVLFEIEGKKVIYTPNLPKGIAGQHHDIIDGSIQIGSGRSLQNIKETCEHELLHEEGASTEGKHEPGDYIYELDEHRNTEVCVRFIYELGRWKATN